MVDKEIIIEWLAKADSDFQFATENLKDGNANFYGHICFHFQQSAEKHLKAYIVAYELEFKKIHELTEILNICKTHNQEFSKLEIQCKFLTDFYISTRYPVSWQLNITQEAVEKAKQFADEIKQFVKNLLTERLK